jgi:hypothetical protein
MAEELIGVTLLYGQGHNEEQICKKDIEKNKEKFSQSYDSIEKKGKKILEYHIKKIIYTISPSQSIQTLKILYQNRNNGQIEELLDTTVSYTEQSNDKDKLSSIEFDDNEEIVDMYFYVKDSNNLVSICITTNFGISKYIGNNDLGTLIKDRELEKKDKVIVGFYVEASKLEGVTGMYCYYVPKIKFGFYKYYGLFLLRAKIKCDKEFKKKLEEKKESFDAKYSLILAFSDFPDTVFTKVASYILDS